MQSLDKMLQEHDIEGFLSYTRRNVQTKVDGGPHLYMTMLHLIIPSLGDSTRVHTAEGVIVLQYDTSKQRLGRGPHLYMTMLPSQHTVTRRFY